MMKRIWAGAMLAAAAACLAAPAGNCAEKKLIKMVVNSGGYGAIGSGITQIDSESVTCPAAASSCTIAFNLQTTMGPSNNTCNSTGTDEWGYYIGVDGVNNGYGIVASPMPAANQELNGSWLGNISIPTGHHTIQMYVSLNEPCYLLNWAVNYSILNG